MDNAADDESNRPREGAQGDANISGDLQGDCVRGIPPSYIAPEGNAKLGREKLFDFPLDVVFSEPPSQVGPQGIQHVVCKPIGIRLDDCRGTGDCRTSERMRNAACGSQPSLFGFREAPSMAGCATSC